MAYLHSDREQFRDKVTQKTTDSRHNSVMMAYLHSDREQFRDAIDLAYEQTGVMVQAIEKDYYVTMLLRLLAQKMPYIVFKGGTSLSKCHKVTPPLLRRY